MRRLLLPETRMVLAETQWAVGFSRWVSGLQMLIRFPNAPRASLYVSAKPVASFTGSHVGFQVVARRSGIAERW